MMTATGTVYPFGDAPRLGNATGGRDPVVELEPTPSRAGYWVLDSAGRVQSFGDAPNLGSAGPLPAGETVTSLSATPSGHGYWMFTTRGRVLAFGDAPFLGDVASVRLNGPVLDSVATPSGRGYYMVAADGGVFAFGDARFAGSTGSRLLNAPVQSLVPDPDGNGYWLVASDGGIFAFSAPFFGSMAERGRPKVLQGHVGQCGRCSNPRNISARIHLPGLPRRLPAGRARDGRRLLVGLSSAIRRIRPKNHQSPLARPTPPVEKPPNRNRQPGKPTEKNPAPVDRHPIGLTPAATRRGAPPSYGARPMTSSWRPPGARGSTSLAE